MAEQTQEGLNKNWPKVIAALLANPSVGAAAKACGLGERTVWRYLQEPEFQKEYKQAQRAVVDSAIAKLQGATEKAVDTLVDNLTCGNDFAENAAATAILSQAFKAIEVRELKDEIEEIKRQLAGRKGLKQA